MYCLYLLRCFKLQVSVTERNMCVLDGGSQRLLAQHACFFLRSVITTLLTYVRILFLIGFCYEIPDSTCAEQSNFLVEAQQLQLCTYTRMCVSVLLNNAHKLKFFWLGKKLLVEANFNWLRRRFCLLLTQLFVYSFFL